MGTLAAPRQKLLARLLVGTLVPTVAALGVFGVLAHEVARRALEDTLSMDIMSRDLSFTDASLRRVFGIMQQAGALARDVPFDPAKFVDESYLAESRK